MNEGKKYHFDKKFLWGASVSAHQVEGGNHNQWSVWELETARVRAAQASYQHGHLPIWKDVQKEAEDPASYISGRAADHFNRYEHDFALAKQLKLDTLRSGIEWSRIEPQEGKFDQQALEHYRTYFKKLKEQGIQPVITLWHWTLPVWFAKKGGFEKRANIKYFTRYVSFLCEHAPELFEGYLLTINEPGTYVGWSYGEGKWPPQGESHVKMVHVLYNLAVAHRRVYRLIKNAYPQAKVGLAHNCAYFYAGDSSLISRLSAKVAHHFANEWFINRVKKKQDFLGLNYYLAWELHGTKVHNPNKKRNDLGWDMQPAKLQPLVEQLYKKYKLPIMVTETGVADRNDQYREWWISENIKAMNGAMKNGAKMLGYIHWSLLDNFEWADGFWPRFGLIEVNYKTQQRKPRESAKFYGRFISSLQARNN